jgi:hypothetical protein
MLNSIRFITDDHPADRGNNKSLGMIRDQPKHFFFFADVFKAVFSF